MSITKQTIEIKDVKLIGNSAIMFFLSNERTFIIPPDKFKAIANLTLEEKKDFEVIDGKNLSFLAIDEIYNLHDLIGL